MGSTSLKSHITAAPSPPYPLPARRIILSRTGLRYAPFISNPYLYLTRDLRVCGSASRGITPVQLFPQPLQGTNGSLHDDPGSLGDRLKELVAYDIHGIGERILTSRWVGRYEVL